MLSLCTLCVPEQVFRKHGLYVYTVRKDLFMVRSVIVSNWSEWRWIAIVPVPYIRLPLSSLVKASAGPQLQLVCCSGRAWRGAAAAVCSLRPFLLWSLLWSSHLINSDCTSHRNFPFSIFCHPPCLIPTPTTQRPPDQRQDKWCPTTWWLTTATQHNSTHGISMTQLCKLSCGWNRELLVLYC